MLTCWQGWQCHCLKCFNKTRHLRCLFVCWLVGFDSNLPSILTQLLNHRFPSARCLDSRKPLDGGDACLLVAQIYMLHLHRQVNKGWLRVRPTNVHQTCPVFLHDEGTDSRVCRSAILDLTACSSKVQNHRPAHSRHNMCQLCCSCVLGYFATLSFYIYTSTCVCFSWRPFEAKPKVHTWIWDLIMSSINEINEF